MTSDGIKKWCIAAAVRATKTAAQAALASIGTTAVAITTLDWPQIAAISATAAVTSVLMSIVGVPEVNEGDSLPKLAKGGDAQ